jgi:hypothetical protein
VLLERNPELDEFCDEATVGRFSFVPDDEDFFVNELEIKELF